MRGAIATVTSVPRGIRTGIVLARRVSSVQNARPAAVSKPEEKRCGPIVGRIPRTYSGFWRNAKLVMPSAPALRITSPAIYSFRDLDIRAPYVRPTPRL
jgi:hypothetical protein